MIKQQAVTVDFKMRRERKNENKFWIKVKATPQSEEIKEIKIDMYQLDSDCQSSYGMGLTPYPLRNDHTYTWDFENGDIIMVFVKYIEQTDVTTWKIAAQGVWMSDGQYFRNGQQLKDTSELFA